MNKLVIGILAVLLLGSFVSASWYINPFTKNCEEVEGIYKGFVYETKQECKQALRDIRKQEAINNFWEKLSQSIHFDKLITSCRRNSDCLIVSDTCCPCNMGGKEIAVNKLGALYYNWYKGDCSNICCLAVYNCHYTNAVCENKQCVLN